MCRELFSQSPALDLVSALRKIGNTHVCVQRKKKKRNSRGLFLTRILSLFSSSSLPQRPCLPNFVEKRIMRERRRSSADKRSVDVVVGRNPGLELAVGKEMKELTLTPPANNGSKMKNLSHRNLFTFHNPSSNGKPPPLCHCQLSLSFFLSLLFSLPSA